MRPAPMFLLWGLLVPLVPAGAGAQPDVPAGPAPPDPWRRVITRAVIEQAGITRPGELFDLLPGWDSWSTDGLHDRHRAANLAPLRTDTYLLFVDGLRLDDDLLETHSLNLLPVTVAEIDSVEFFAFPVLVAGTFAPRGAVHIHTRRPGRGPELTAAVFAENETGDPGPYRYLGSTAGDVEHIGPEAELVLGWGAERNWVRLSAVNRNHPVADTYIYNRTVNLAGRLPAVLTRASNLHAHLELGRSRHDLSASCQWGHDFLFHRGPGLEVAADTRLHQIGASGTVPLLPSLGLRYRLSTTTGLMTSWAPLGGPAYDPELRRVSGNLEIGDPSDASAWAVGMTREATRTGESGCRQGGAHDWGTLYARLADLGTTDFEYALDLSAVLKGRESRLSAGLRTRFRPSSRLRIDAGIAHAPVPFTFDHGYRYWTTTCEFDTAPHELPGFTYLAGTTGYHDYDAFESTVTAVDLGVGLALAGEGSIALGYFSRSFSDLNLESYQSLPDFLKNHWPESWADIDGSLQGVRGDLALTVRDGLRLTLGGEYRLRTGSDEAFTQRLQAIPRFIAVGLLAWAPHPSLSLTLRGRYTSATCWSEYRHQIRTDPVDPYLEELTRYVDPDLAAGTALDLSVGKWFWGRRLRWVLVGHNLLNRRLRSHPAGAGFDLSLATRFELHLGTDR